MSSLIGWAQTQNDPWKGDAIMFRMSWLYIFRSAVHIGITSLTLQMILGDNPVLIWDQYLVITVPADGLAPNGARPAISRHSIDNQVKHVFFTQIMSQI